MLIRRLKLKIISKILFFFTYTLYLTYRFTIVGKENKEKAKSLSAHGIFVYACWHQNILSALLGHVGESYTMIISASKDGDIMSALVSEYGHTTARGSSSRKGKEALIAVVKEMKSKKLSASMAVDGPKGPLYEVKKGALLMAQLTESAVVPMSFAASSAWVFDKSWDKFILPKPFSKIVMTIGEPIVIPQNTSIEDFEKLQIFVADKIHAGTEKSKEILKSLIQ